MGWLKGEPLAVTRGNTDKYGNRDKSAVGSVEGIFAWGAPSKNFGVAAGRSQGDTQTVQLYVKKSVDLRARDEVVRANGEKYTVVGRPQWDQAHPWDGFDFEYKVIWLEAINAASG